MSVNRNAILGPLLILLGIFMFFRGQVDWGTGTIFEYFWPTLFVIPTGLFMHWLYFGLLQRRGVGVLVPGGILLTVGAVCQLATLFDSWHIMWPGFLLAPAVGLFELYWFGGRNKWLLIPINILTVLSVLFFAVFSVGALLGTVLGGQPMIAGALIVVGGLVFLTRKRGHH
ncbi:hypothetical protein [Paenibacillus methanolicus]|uniref:DUF5668 domain-containing protein n=1 Tax=Paenibacillus methanolicus TaxID=582686 RepID=A0A5S5CA83_9BACL|nr:hypothetical protein [Paenibacillus methanolicus]TYP75412.1 hypothetical protein BCM02_10488 [Paenibacillus methanolicus]